MNRRSFFSKTLAAAVALVAAPVVKLLGQEKPAFYVVPGLWCQGEFLRVEKMTFCFERMNIHASHVYSYPVEAHVATVATVDIDDVVLTHYEYPNPVSKVG